jgi:hypothetical protein
MSRSLPFSALVTIARARRPLRPIERHAWAGIEPRSGQLSLCRDVQFSATLTDGLAPLCDHCRSAGLGAVGLTASALDLVGASALSLGGTGDAFEEAMVEEQDRLHESRKAAIDSSWAPGELQEAYGR